MASTAPKKEPKQKLSNMDKLSQSLNLNITKQVAAMTDTQGDADKIIKETLAQAGIQTGENPNKIETHDVAESIAEADQKGMPLGDQQLFIPLDQLDFNPFQPRRFFDEKSIKELAEALDTIGQIEPIVVRQIDDRFQLIVGERRVRALRLLGRTEAEAIIRQVDDGMSALMALSENFDREDLSDYEFGLALHSAQDQFPNKTKLAEYIKKPRMELYRYLAFGALPKWIIARLDVNPFLLNRHTAFAIKTLLAEPESEEYYKEPIIKAMDAIEANSLTQELFIDRVKRLAREANSQDTHSIEVDPSKFVKKGYTVNGVKVGNFKFNEKGLSIKINYEAIDNGDLDAIHEFIYSRLIKIESTQKDPTDKEA